MVDLILTALRAVARKFILDCDETSISGLRGFVFSRNASCPVGGRGDEFAGDFYCWGFDGGAGEWERLSGVGGAV
jgi:hypothetical protein